MFMFILKLSWQCECGHKWYIPHPINQPIFHLSIHPKNSLLVWLLLLKKVGNSTLAISSVLTPCFRSSSCRDDEWGVGMFNGVITFYSSPLSPSLSVSLPHSSSFSYLYMSTYVHQFSWLSSAYALQRVLLDWRSELTMIGTLYCFFKYLYPWNCSHS